MCGSIHGEQIRRVFKARTAVGCNRKLHVNNDASFSVTVEQGAAELLSIPASLRTRRPAFFPVGCQADSKRRWLPSFGVSCSEDASQIVSF